MAGVKWIKITTGMFEDEKIDFIESLPEADAILIIWVKLLTMAGKCNADGFIYLTESIPYTEEMLAHRFRRPATTIRLALETLKRLEMVEINGDGYLRIINWEKHQNVDGLEKIREQTRKRVAKHRKKKKLSPQKNSKKTRNVTRNATVTPGNAIELEEELDLELDKDKRTTTASGNNSTNDMSELVKIYENVIGMINSFTHDWLNDIISLYGFTWCKEALLEAEKRGKRNKKYVEGILQNWQTSGGMKKGGDSARADPGPIDYEAAKKSKYGW